MAGPTGNPYASNRHADVLNEEPTDEAAKMRLLEEVKNRAKGAFVQKDMPSAELLYGKAIKILDTVPGKQEATLYSNRSMVRLNLNKVEEALQDANMCIKLDATFVKAYHRKAQALVRLNEWVNAIAAAEEGAKLDPSNKAFAEILEKAKAEQEKDAEEKSKLRADAQDVRVELHNASTARAPAAAAAKKPAAHDGASSMRGYKTTSDGRTTSYFHTEISEEAKKLIEAQGFGKPQKLEGPVDEETNASGGGSTWNQAGTYEEKGRMKWFQGHVDEKLTGVEFVLPESAGGHVIRTTKVIDVKGDANISVSRGKRRYILDASFAVEFEMKLESATGSGKIIFSEVTSTLEDEPEVQVEISSDTPAIARDLFTAFVKSSSQGLQPLLTAKVRDIVKDFLAQ